MDSVQLAGVALAALLSENFILVNCLGIGTQVEAFHSTTAARRTGLSLTLAMVVTVFFTWCADFLVLRHFGWGVSAHPGLLPHCPPHCLPAAKGSPSLAGALPSNRRRPGLGIHQLCGAGCGLSGRPAQLHPVPGPHLRPVRRPGRPGGPDELRRPAGGDQPHQLPRPFRGRPSRW